MLLKKLEKAVHSGKLESRSCEPKILLRKAAHKKWIVYSKPPFAGPEQVLKYLGRYTHRIAISNGRLISMKDGKVTFRWRDRTHGDKLKLMTLDAVEFMRRFLLHVVPKGLMRIRHYGLLANVHKHRLLPRCRELLGVEVSGCGDTDDPGDHETWQELLYRVTGKDVTLCPHCKKGHLVVKERLSALGSRPSVQPRTRSP